MKDARSFAAVVGPGARVLVLGSMPGQRSLADQQYYAHPRNLFWPFMGELFGAGSDLAYAERLDRLVARGVALWDVLAACEREGSLDAAIVRRSEVPNAIPALLEAHPSVRVVACNGAKAHQLFRRHVAPALEPAVAARVVVRALPSTSPANASIPREAKRAAWAQGLRAT